MNNILSLGDMIIDTEKSSKYRVIAIWNDEVTLCQLEVSTLVLQLMDYKLLFSLVEMGRLQIAHEERFVFNKNTLPIAALSKFEERQKIMNEVVDLYGPQFMELSGHKTKDSLNSIIKKYNIARNTFWRMCLTYLQSGMQPYSLVDTRYFGTNTGKNYVYETKTGRPTEYLSNTGIVITSEIQSYFDEALKSFKSGRYTTIKDAFDKMNILHFTKTEIINGIPSVTLLPEGQRPTFRQFSYYFSKHLTKQEKDLIKTSALEQHNNQRLIISDTLYGVQGPGDMVEIDACEADISLVSVVDPTKTVGRPIVYFMIDVYSRIILAASIAFDNNSILGLTSLFLNLADNKQEYCKRYGISYENDKIWPSNIIPKRVRVDRGAEFRGKEFERICDELNIERIVVLPGQGSLKGIVEQSFRQLHLSQNPHLEGHGLISKRHDSDHHRSATLNIEEYTKMVIGFILTHNQKSLATYPLTQDMILKRIKPIPALIWEYGLQSYSPRQITAYEQYLFNLMTPIKAKVSRKGISYKGLWYINFDDRDLNTDMYNAGNKRIPFDARMDMRNVGFIYYLRNNRLVTASLNPLLNGNAEYMGLTMKEYNDFKQGKQALLMEGRISNEELSAFTYSLNETIVEAAEKPGLPSPKNMRETREIEKQKKVKSNQIKDRLSNDEQQFVIDAQIEYEPILLPADPDETIQEAIVSEDVIEDSDLSTNIESTNEKTETKEKEPLETYSSWEEALDDWWR